MNHKADWNRLAQVVVVLLVALGLKQYYSTASANQLRWILAPTTMLVSLVSGESFQFESYAGYITSDHTFVVAAACAGVNFLITAFLMLSLGKLWVKRSAEAAGTAKVAKVSWRFIPTAALVAYLATLVANTVRITIALQLQRTSPQIGGLSRGELHRFEGIFVYFGFLLLLFAMSERGRTNKPSRLLSLSVFPLLIYYVTTLGIPLANSAYRQRLVDGDFQEHFVFVLLTPVILIVPVAAFRYYRSHLLMSLQNR
jgi:exosortase K